MIAFAAAGLVIGWLISRRRAWSLLLLTVALAGLAVHVLSNHFAVDTMADALVFWIAAQLAWFLTHFVSASRTIRGEIADEATPLG